MPEKTRVAILEEFNKPFKIIEMDIPELSPGQVLVKITSAGICGSDVHIQQGKDPRINLPTILGHEGVGIIARINGEKKTPLGEKLKEGDKVIWNRGVLCGKCYFCVISRQPSLCENRWAYGIHRSIKVPPHLNGCYAEHIILSEKTDMFLIDDRDPAVFVPASCSGATAAHAFEYAQINVNDNVLIQGPGPLGIFLVAFAKSSGARNIIVIGGTQERLEMCKIFGANYVINRNTQTNEQIMDMVMSITNNRGADVVFESAGNIDAISDGIPLVRTGGKYISVGFGEPAGSVNFPWFEYIIRKNLTLQGVWVSDSQHTLQALRLVQSNFEAFSRMITHRYSLDKADDAIKSVSSRQAVKAVIIP